MLKLHTKLGKPIPSSDPVVVGQQKASTTAAAPKPAVTSAKPQPPPAVAAAATAAVKKVLATPKITFVGKTALLHVCIQTWSLYGY